MDKISGRIISTSCCSVSIPNLTSIASNSSSVKRKKRGGVVLVSARPLLFPATLLLLLAFRAAQAHRRIPNGLKTESFLSPDFPLEPGSVSNKFYYNLGFPKGHIAIKSFDAEVVDERGSPVPLHETYLHHWIVVIYYQRKKEANNTLGQADRIILKNNGLCDDGLIPYFGLGSETRRMSTYVPEPYGIEAGSTVGVPSGYEEAWLLNVHAIDTRGAEDEAGCNECRCDLYNVTDPLSPTNHKGGLRCCHDGARCRVKEGFKGLKRSLYLRYKVTYVDWDDALVLPVNIYILDVTDIWTNVDESRGVGETHRCLVEYDVQSCLVGVNNDGCTHTKTLTVSFPAGGNVIYGVGHQHAGGIGLTLYGEGGREICSSIPTYGTGDEPGNEAGYIVGMSTCYPSPGSVKISSGEMVTLVSNYSSTQRHTGVMGIFYLLISESSEKQSNEVLHYPANAHEVTIISKFCYGMALFGIVVVVIFVLSSKRRRGEGYETVTK